MRHRGNVALTQRFGSSHSDQHKLKTATAPVFGTLARLWNTIGDPT